MIAALLSLMLAPPGAIEFAEQAAGLSTSAGQSQNEGYDFVASEMWQVMPEADDGVWLYQQNWILGPRADRSAAREVRDRHDQLPYFQVAIHLRDFGDGEVHTTTYRIKGEARAVARLFAANGGAFDEEWLGEVACMGKLNAVGAGHWSGHASCPNGYKGGVRVESVSVRSLNSHVNWDRGFNLEGEHIWGPADGGYVFTPWEDK
ncbi:MAG: CpcT/CpeT family chromophore lyase [Pseudomonadota bacterium]